MREGNGKPGGKERRLKGREGSELVVGRETVMQAWRINENMVPID